MKFSYQEKEDIQVLDETKESIVPHLVVYNDEVNSFDFVIECFQEVLNHTSQQAEQLSYIIHYKGKATVKSEELQKLKPKKDALVDRGLSAVIEYH